MPSLNTQIEKEAVKRSKPCVYASWLKYNHTKTTTVCGIRWPQQSKGHSNRHPVSDSWKCLIMGTTVSVKSKFVMIRSGRCWPISVLSTSVPIMRTQVAYIVNLLRADPHAMRPREHTVPDVFRLRSCFSLFLKLFVDSRLLPSIHTSFPLLSQCLNSYACPPRFLMVIAWPTARQATPSANLLGCVSKYNAAWHATAIPSDASC